ncbi:MAG: hypothetical protein Q4D14_04825 [Bacteroidales bacterium]|nr:hypothetical protein [Bacteroidales bacterium]
MSVAFDNYNFGFDTIDANAFADRKAMCLDYFFADGRHLPIDRDYFRHHSDLMAEFLRFKGVAPKDYVVVCGLKQTFEQYLLLTALLKLDAVAVFVDSDSMVSALQRFKPKAVVVNAQSEAVAHCQMHPELLPKLMVSVGMPTPKGWKDLHRGSWLTREFQPCKDVCLASSDLVVMEFDSTGERCYTRSDLFSLCVEDGWQGFVSSQLQQLPYIVRNNK